MRDNESLRTANTLLLQQREASRKIESRLRAALEIAQLGVWEYSIESLWDNDAAAGVMQFDKRCCEIFGIGDKSTISSEDLFALIHPDDRPRLQNEIRRISSLPRTGVYDTEYRVVRPDGTQRSVAMRGHVLHRGGGTAELSNSSAR